MKMKIKLLLSFNLAVLIMCGLVSSASALYKSEVGDLDPLISVANLSNSGADSEATWINEVLGTSYDATYVEANKVDKLEIGFELVIDGIDTSSDDESDQWGFALLKEEGYFLVKTGNGTYDHWLFKNEPNTLFGTVIIDYLYAFRDQNGEEVQVRFDARNIGSISHLTKAGPTPVPEPSTLLLLGAGLAGLGGFSRRFRR